MLTFTRESTKIGPIFKSLSKIEIIEKCFVVSIFWAQICIHLVDCAPRVRPCYHSYLIVVVQFRFSKKAKKMAKQKPPS